MKRELVNWNVGQKKLSTVQHRKTHTHTHTKGNRRREGKKHRG